MERDTARSRTSGVLAAPCKKWPPQSHRGKRRDRLHYFLTGLTCSAISFSSSYTLGSDESSQESQISDRSVIVVPIMIALTSRMTSYVQYCIWHQQMASELAQKSKLHVI